MIDEARLKSIESTWELTCDSEGRPTRITPSAFVAGEQVMELVAEVRRLQAERDALRAALQLVFGDGVHRGGISVAAWVAVRDALATHPAPDAPSDKESHAAHEAAMAQEREECARLVERHGESDDPVDWQCSSIAAAIRARGEQPYGAVALSQPAASAAQECPQGGDAGKAPPAPHEESR